MLLSRAQFADSAIRYGGTPLPVSWTNLALGIAVSLVLHGLLIAFFHTGWMPHAVPHILPPPTMTVWLRMEPPPAPPETLPPPPVVLAEPVLPAIRQQRELSRNKADKKAAPAMTWVPPRVNKPDNAAPSSTAEAGAGAADPFYPSAPVSPGRFDVETARRAARRFADEPDPAKAGTALAQLPPKKLATETPLARSIRAAGRGDCKDGIPGGLLAPLVLALDKKDHGCKW
jgi:hypothetical protein